MHDISYNHQHELDEGDFSECCKDCLSSVDIIKPHIMAFAARIKRYTREMLAALSPGDLYRLYQILDDLAHIPPCHWRSPCNPFYKYFTQG